MKLFQNPYVVGVLALLAALLVFRKPVGSLWEKWQTRHQAANKAAPVPSAPAAGGDSNRSALPQTPKTPRLEQERRIDLNEVGWKVNASPRRDPFQAIASVGGTNRLYPAAWELFRLTAIWRQTGSSLAVINSKIVAQGDTIVAATNRAPTLGGENAVTFTVESIEGDEVWL